MTWQEIDDLSFNSLQMEPIGYLSAPSVHSFEARRQASVDTDQTTGEIRLRAGQQFEQALEDLRGFDRIWLIYAFHHNSSWKPKVQPPRGPRTKRGVFATRAPYRPNPLGLSCVQLVDVKGLTLTIQGHDLLDGTPILDIKPYLPYADSFPDAKTGWLQGLDERVWEIEFSEVAQRQIHWLHQNGLTQLKTFVLGQLEYEPLDDKRKRVSAIRDNRHCLAYRTWRVEFETIEDLQKIQIHSIRSGYSVEDLIDTNDPYLDKELHRRFVALFAAV